MAVQILESVSIHESVILRVLVRASPGDDGFANQFINIGPAFAGQADENFRAPGRVANFLWREFLELLMSEKHDIDVLAHDHASGCFVRELGIKAKAEALEKAHRLVEVFDGKVNEYLCSHDSVCVVSVWFFGF